MRTIKRVLSVIPACVLWLVISTVLWGFIFNIATDTSPKKKITVFIDAENVADADLAEYLEADKPSGIKMIKVHPFSYAMFGDDEITRADVFIIGEKEIEKYVGAFAECLVDGDYFVLDGVRVGVKIYDKTTKTGAAAQYIGYGDDDYYLLFGNKSAHLDDGAALDVAKKIINLT